MKYSHLKKFIINLFFFIGIFTNTSFSIENKIILKINNEIITSIDVENEYRYLLALNKSLDNLSRNEVLEISKKSIIKEKIKNIEIYKAFKNPVIPEEYLEQVLKSVYQRLDINNLSEFKKYLESKNVKYNNVKKKIEIETLWNELIVSKYSSKIQVNEGEIRKEIINSKKEFTKSYLISEILFEISNSNELSNKYEEIKTAIEKEGFENTAVKYSSSSTSSLGGTLGWIDEKSVNGNLRLILSNLKINEITEPITVPGGFMILKVNEIKKVKKNKNIDAEVKRIVVLKKNNQLNQFSKIYFNKIKKDFKIDEI
jgi:peptidyl-prolyl cis-trans isomerase SurA